ncbi:MAG: hypothetical protein V3S46_09700 [Nitrospinota bacterium]
MIGEKKSGIIVMVVLFVVLLSPMIYSAVSNGFFGETTMPKLVLPTNAEKCIEDTDYMRANHMKLLLHVRDDVVREGVRKVTQTLSNCKTCHTKRAEFCDKCHEYAGAKPECFGCHYMP